MDKETTVGPQPMYIPLSCRIIVPRVSPRDTTTTHGFIIEPTRTIRFGITQHTGRSNLDFFISIKPHGAKIHPHHSGG